MKSSQTTTLHLIVWKILKWSWAKIHYMFIYKKNAVNLGDIIYKEVKLEWDRYPITHMLLEWDRYPITHMLLGHFVG